MKRRRIVDAKRNKWGTTNLRLPIIDLSSPEKFSTSRLIRQACLDHGFFYLTNHGVSEELMEGVFKESKKLFSLPLDEKMVMARRSFRGYSPLYDEKLESSSTSKGDSKEMFTLGSSDGDLGQLYPNQWPPEVGRKLLRLVALALNLEENFFERVGAFNDQAAVVRLLRYPGEEETCGASPHSDFGMITLLVTDGVPGLQVCKDKDKEPRVWEDVPGIKGAYVVNIGDLMERWTNWLFRSTLHRVKSVGKERYSVAVFLDPDPNCVVECLESCCSETSPPRYPPIRARDYFHQRFSQTLSSYSSLA